MDADFTQFLFEAHKHGNSVPSPQATSEWIEDLLGLLFPERSREKIKHKAALEKRLEHSRHTLCILLGPIEHQLKQSTEHSCELFFNQIPKVHKLLLQDAAAISAGDPAAISQTEVILTYPGFLALAVFRMAHEFFKLDIPLFARLLTEYAHQKTGIDIHPGAQIGENFCIDHGTGVVIGGTSIIGKGVKIYQGVTLGALSVSKEMAAQKRHPTIEDGVVIYAGATILGGDTLIGKDSIIGGNVWLIDSVPPQSRIYYRGHTSQISHPQFKK